MKLFISVIVPIDVKDFRNPKFMIYLNNVRTLSSNIHQIKLLIKEFGSKKISEYF